jgi:hypothetical protein
VEAVEEVLVVEQVVVVAPAVGEVQTQQLPEAQVIPPLPLHYKDTTAGMALGVMKLLVEAVAQAELGGMVRQALIWGVTAVQEQHLQFQVAL